MRLDLELLKAKEAIYTVSELEDVKCCFEPQNSDYQRELKDKYLNPLGDYKFEVSPELRGSFTFSFNYIDLADKQMIQQQRVASTSHELVMFMNVDSLSEFFKDRIKEILISSFNENYQGLAFWSPTEVYYHSPYK